MADSLSNPESVARYYRKVALIRTNDDRTVATLKAGRVIMPYYSPRGQEVIPAAISMHLGDKDFIVTIYRGIHDMLAKGIPLKLLWAEIAGRRDGTCKGKGGPMHLTYPDKGIMVTTGIVGSSLPIANGLAWASLLEGDDLVTIAYFGDGASNIGAFHEALNLASVWKLPVIFVCQNNLFGEHSRIDRTTSVARIADRAVAYGMPGIHVDGNDPIVMYRAAGEAIARARAGLGPTLIEAVTFRFNGHVFGDADDYMNKDEKRAAIAADPVPRFRRWAIENGHLTENETQAIEADVAREIDDAIEFALASPFPDVAELELDVVGQETTR